MSAIFGETLTFGQTNGPDIRLRVTGDEFYATYETLDGYTAVSDTDRGFFCYGYLHNGVLVSSGVPVTAPPAPVKAIKAIKEPYRSGPAPSALRNRSARRTQKAPPTAILPSWKS